MKKTKKFRNFFLVAAIAFFITSCGILEQAGEMYNLTRCEFKLNTVEDVHLAGVYIQNYDQFSDLNFTDALKLTNAFLSKNLPLDFTLNIATKNPNQQKAALNKLQWILYIDNIEMTRGTTNKRIEIPPNGGMSNLPLNLNIELFNALSGDSKDAILNFGFNLAGQGNKPTRITVKAKPTVYVSGRAIDYPGYITIENEFTSGGNSGSEKPGGGSIRL